MVAAQLSARELFRAAYENRYTWDANFPGYRANVTYSDGNQSWQGAVEVSADLKPSISGIDEPEVVKLIHGQLFEVAIHRVRRGFEDTHGKNEFEFGNSDNDGTVEILVNGKSAGDRYKVRDNEVVLVHRHIHGVVVTINTFSTHKSAEGYLSHRYDSVYHDPTTGEQKGDRSEFEDEYVTVGGYQLLSARTIRSASGTISFRFSDLELLAPAA
ncbi:DUF3386 domain-containing protein [Synechococcus elongatus IITB3]|uniref:DUF3386 domain-containing protein n=1 Tax=Synechococcus elongatus TaxID=32046 RepID=UPI0030CA7E7F